MPNIDPSAVRDACESLRADMISFLDRLVRFESISGFEGPCMRWIGERFSPVADLCELLPVPESIVDDPEFSETVHGMSYKGRPNVRAVLHGDGSGGSVVFNAHADVVPPTKRQERPFDPYIRNGAMYGRGTCDDKGQIAVLWTMLSALWMLGIKPGGDVILHLVERVKSRGPSWLADHAEMHFPYRHDASRIDPGLPFVRALEASYRAAGIETELGAVTSSMDAWLYTNLLGIPALATGCGSLGDAHTIDEHVVIDEIIDEAAALALFVADWCGVQS